MDILFKKKNNLSEERSRMIMTLSEFIKILLQLQQEGKGDYAMKWCYWSDEGNIDQPPIVFDKEQKIYI